MNIPVKRLKEGSESYFPMSVLDSVFLNKNIEVKTTVGGLSKGSVLSANLSLQRIMEKILSLEGTDIDELAESKVDKYPGKGLSTNDFTNECKAKLDSALTSHQDISGKVDKVEGKGLSTNDLTNERLSILMSAITSHQDISGKVDKVEGKGLSTNDFTDAFKIKLNALHNYDDEYVRTEIVKKLNRDEVINRVSATSLCPVQSKVIKSELDKKVTIDSQTIVIGTEGEATGNYAIALGRKSKSYKNQSIAVGNGAVSNANNATQIGVGTNTSDNSLKFRSTEVVDGSGKIQSSNLHVNNLIPVLISCTDNMNEDQKSKIGSAINKAETVNNISPDTGTKNITLNNLICDSSDKVYAKNSKDPANWIQSNKTDSSWYSVSYGNGKFVACCDYTPLWYSSDGINWQRCSSPTAQWMRVSFCNDKFIASSRTEGLWYSVDGINWIQSNKRDGSFTSITYGDGKFVSCDDGIWYSLDGINWIQSNKRDGEFQSLCYGNGKFISGSNSSGIWYSTDGINWIQSNKRDDSFNSITYGDGKFVALNGNEDFSYLWYSTDGIDWIKSSSFTGFITHISFNNNRFVVSAEGYGIWYSKDSINYIQGDNISTAFYASTYGDGKYIAASNNEGLWYCEPGNYVPILQEIDLTPDLIVSKIQLMTDEQKQAVKEALGL